VTSRLELMDRLRATYSPPRTSEPVTEEALAGARSTPLADGVVLEVGGRTLLAAPVKPFTTAELPPETADSWSELAMSNPHMRFVAGRYVEGERANRNGALWSAGDLEFGALGVRGGPLNWLHQQTKVVGTLLDAALIQPSTEAAATARPYIATVAALWPWVHPKEVAAYVDFAEAGKAYQSMECVAERVGCGECGAEFPYLQTVAAKDTVCVHIRERSATRRFINPSFLGAGTIVAPVEPGWDSAHVAIMPTASRLAEAASAGAPESMSTSEFEHLVAAVLASV
jgi:hypothetical protein